MALPLTRRHVLLGAAALTAGCAGPRAATPEPDTMITVEGVALHFARLGSGPPVVLVHGASGNLADMTFRLGPALAKRARSRVNTASTCASSENGTSTARPSVSEPSTSTGCAARSSKKSPPKRYPPNGVTSRPCAVPRAGQRASVTAASKAARHRACLARTALLRV